MVPFKSNRYQSGAPDSIQPAGGGIKYLVGAGGHTNSEFALGGERLGNILNTVVQNAVDKDDVLQFLL